MAEPSPPLSPTKDPLTTLPNSASSSSTAATPPADKKTREQPNLSDCHCCCRRVNHTNPEDRLQPLESVWRIVLLCSRCHNKVSSGQTCPYCFKQTGNSGDLVTCSVCKSIIHEICVRDYGNCTPWCNLGLGLGEFKTCVDCWVPDLLKSSMRACGRSENKDVSIEDNYGDAKDGFGKRTRNAKFEVAKKVKMAAKAKAKEQELRKAMTAKKALNLAAATKKGGGGQKDGDSDSSNAVEIDDAELAIQLRRVFSILPIMSRCEFFLDPIDLNVWKIKNWSGISYKRSSLGTEHSKGQKKYSSSTENGMFDCTGENGSSSDANGFELGLSTYKRDKRRKLWNIHDGNLMVFEARSIQPEQKFELHSDDAKFSCKTDVSEALLCSDANGIGSRTDIDRCIPEALICDNADQTTCIGVDRLGEKLALYRRTRFRLKGQLNAMVNDSGDCCFCDSHGVTCKPKCGQLDDEDHMMQFLVKCETEKIFPNGNCNAEQDRYYLKYFKRVATTKSYLSHPHSDTVQCEKQVSAPALSNSRIESSLKCDRELRLPNESSDAGLGRYCFKYAKRMKGSNCMAETKLRSDLIQLQSEASAPGLIVHRTVESRTMSSFT